MTPELIAMQEQCPSRVSGDIAPYQVIPRPSPSTAAMFENTNRNANLFLRAARIERGSEKHKEFMTTIQALHRQYLHPFKYVEEQPPDCVEQLIAKAQISLPWLDKYEDGWPARIYLKRYVDTRRPHLMCTKYAHAKRRAQGVQKSKASHEAHLQPTRNLEDPGDRLGVHDFTTREFLGSFTPSLEHHLDAFVGLGIKDRETLQAFLSWPQVIQAQFLDEGHGALQLTSLERKVLLVGCGLLAQKALQRSLERIVKPGSIYP